MTTDQIKEHLKQFGWQDKELAPDIIEYFQWRLKKEALINEAYESAENNVGWSRNLAGI